MWIVLRIAWRNLWRNTRRTLLTTSTVGLGLALLLLALGLGDGGHMQMIDGAVRMGSGHAVVQAPGYQEQGGLERTLKADQTRAARRWLEDASRRFSIRATAPRIFGSALASSADGSTGVRIVGVDPASERQASDFAAKVVKGEFLEPGARDIAVVGSGVARKLELELGGRLVLMGQAAGSDEIESRLVRLAGVLHTGLDEHDQTLVLVPLETADAFYRLDGEIHQLAVILEDQADSGRLVAEGRRRVPAPAVLGWQEALPELYDYVVMDDAGNYVFNLFLFLLIAFMVLNTLLMSVLERAREFTLLDALGLPPASRFLMVMAEATYIAALSCLLGLAVGYPLHLYLAARGLPLEWFGMSDVSAAGVVIDPVLYSYLSWGRIGQSMLLVFGLTLLLALLPARRAARSGNVQLLGT